MSLQIPSSSSNDGMHEEERDGQSMITRCLSFGMPNKQRVIQVNTEASHKMSVVTIMEGDTTLYITVRAPYDKDAILRANVTAKWICSAYGPQEATFTECHSVIYSRNPYWEMRLDAFLPFFTTAVAQNNTIAVFDINVSIQEKEEERFLPIPSGKVKVEGEVFRVSKELLAAHSQFFSSLFYGDFKERNEEVVELKDVSAEAFKSLLHSLVSNNFRDNSVKNVLELTEVANRFQVLNVVKKCVGRLLTMDLSDEVISLADLLLLSDQCRDEKLLEHVLSSFTSTVEICSAFREVASRVSADTSIAVVEHMAHIKLLYENPQLTLELSPRRVDQSHNGKFRLKITNRYSFRVVVWLSMSSYPYKKSEITMINPDTNRFINFTRAKDSSNLHVHFYPAPCGTLVAREYKNSPCIILSFNQD